MYMSSLTSTAMPVDDASAIYNLPWLSPKLHSIQIPFEFPCQNTSPPTDGELGPRTTHAYFLCPHPFTTSLIPASPRSGTFSPPYPIPQPRSHDQNLMRVLKSRDLLVRVFEGGRKGGWQMCDGRQQHAGE